MSPESREKEDFYGLKLVVGREGRAMPRESTPRRERMVLVVRERGKGAGSKEVREHGLGSTDRVRRAKFMGLIALSFIILLLILGVCAWPTFSDMLQSSEEASRTMKELDAFQLSEFLERLFGRSRK